MGIKKGLFKGVYAPQQGFLLVEALIALSAVIIFSFVIAYVQSQASFLRGEGVAYCKAANVAQRIFERLSANPGLQPPNLMEGLDIQVSQERLHEGIPYKRIGIEISWISVRGERKSLLFSGGIIDEA